MIPGTYKEKILWSNADSYLLRVRSVNSFAPGGAVNFNERREDAIRREIKEEFGVDIDILGLLHVSDEILTKQGQHWVATTFLAKIKNGQTPKVMEPEKCDEIGWFALDNLPSPISYITSLDLKEYKKPFGKREKIVICPICEKKLSLHRKRITYDHNGKEYNAEIFCCKEDDAWVEFDIPKQSK